MIPSGHARMIPFARAPGDRVKQADTSTRSHQHVFTPARVQVWRTFPSRHVQCQLRPGQSRCGVLQAAVRLVRLLHCRDPAQKFVSPLRSLHSKDAAERCGKHLHEEAPQILHRLSRPEARTESPLFLTSKGERRRSATVRAKSEPQGPLRATRRQTRTNP